MKQSELKAVILNSASERMKKKGQVAFDNGLVTYIKGKNIDKIYHIYGRVKDKSKVKELNTHIKINLIKKKLEKVDHSTFKVIKSPNYNLLAKDKKHVYFQGKIIEGINPDSYVIIKEFATNEKKEGGYNCGSTGYVIRDKGKEYILEEK